MTWAVERRLDYVDWVLLRRGFISRHDLCEQFGIHPNQATTDLAEFQTRHPYAMTYDASAKTYVAHIPYRSHRKLTRRVLAAIDGLTATRHPMAWRLP